MNHHKVLALSIALLLSQPVSAMFKNTPRKKLPQKAPEKNAWGLPEKINSSSSFDDLKKAAETISPEAPITPISVATALASIERTEPIEGCFNDDSFEIEPKKNLDISSETIQSGISATCTNEDNSTNTEITEEVLIATVEHEQYSDVEDELPLFEPKATTTTRRNSWFFGAPTAQALLNQLKKEDAIQAEEAFQLRRDIENAIDTLTKSIKLHDKKQDNLTAKTINPEIQDVLAKIDANAETIQTIEKLIDEAKRKHIHLDFDVKTNARGWIEKHDAMLEYLTDLIKIKKDTLYSGEIKLNDTFDARTPNRIAQRLTYLKPNRNTKQLKKARDLADWAILELATNIDSTLNNSQDIIQSTEKCHAHANTLISLLNAVDENYKRNTEIQISEDTHGQAFNALEQYRLKSYQANLLRNQQTKDQQHNVINALNIIANRKLKPSISKMNIDDSKDYVKDLTFKLNNFKN